MPPHIRFGQGVAIAVRPPLSTQGIEREVPLLSPGIELLGVYEGSGLKEPPYLVARGDGTVVTLSRLLYLVAAELDGERDLNDVAGSLSGLLGREVTGQNVAYLIHERLRPLGIVAAPDGLPSSTVGSQRDPVRKRGFLALSFRRAMVPVRFVAAFAKVLSPLFRPPVVTALLVASLSLNVWLFAFHGVGRSFEEVLARPALLLAAYGLLFASMAFHELGHAAACRYSGGRPGPIGIGIYLIWLVFYNDVTDSYRLGRRGRLRTDLGGIYFNAVLGVASGSAYLISREELFAVVAAMQVVLALQQLLPFARLDGHYILADLVGVPDLFSRMRGILLSAIPGRPQHPSAAALKPKARLAITAWLVATMCIIAASIFLAIVEGPRFVAASWDSLSMQYEALTNAIEDGNVVSAVLALLGMLFALVPLIGILILLVFGAGARVRLGARLLRKRVQRLTEPSSVSPLTPATPPPMPGSEEVFAPPAPSPVMSQPAALAFSSPPISAVLLGPAWQWRRRHSGLLIPTVCMSVELVEVTIDQAETVPPGPPFSPPPARGIALPLPPNGTGHLPSLGARLPRVLVQGSLAAGGVMAPSTPTPAPREALELPSRGYPAEVTGEDASAPGPGPRRRPPGDEQPSPRRRKRRAARTATAAATVLVAVGVAVAVPRLDNGEPSRPGEPTGTASFPGQSRKHVNGEVDYQQIPPVGGPHAPIWLNCGIYDHPVPKENAVHSLEHGAVWVTYDPGLARAEIELLQRVVSTSFIGSDHYVILSPYPNQKGSVVATAWGKQLRLSHASNPALVVFIEQFGNGPQAPEQGAPCTGGVGSPVA